MAYDKHVWTCGEAITTEKLNHMEDGIASGGGYECIEESVLLTDETATTTYDPDEQCSIEELAYSQPITADKLRITFNGTAYECNVSVFEGVPGYYYGGMGENGVDFSEYPFAIASVSSEPILTINTLYTQTAGTHTIKIEVVEESVTTTPCFEKAVESVVKGGKAFTNVAGGTCGKNTYTEYNITYNDFINARNNGTNIVYTLTDTDELQARNIVAFNCIEGSEWYEVQAFYVHVTADVPPTVTWIPLVLFCDTTDGYMRDVNCWQLPS